MTRERPIQFVVVGGPHGGPTENPTCYVRTTQRGKYQRWTRPRRSKRTGELLPPRLTQWARYQDYIDHVRREMPAEDYRLLVDHYWPLVAGREAKLVLDVVVQFRGRAHSDADHVASTIADALFPAPLRKRKKPTHSRRFRSRETYVPVWPRAVLERAPGDRGVLARTIDFRDGQETAFVAIRIKGPYPRTEWLDPGAHGFPRVELHRSIVKEDEE